MNLPSIKNWRLMMVLVVAVAASAWIGFGVAERYFIAGTAEQNLSTLRIAVAGLRGELRRYQPLPALIADKASIRELLENPTDPIIVEDVNLKLKDIAETVDASDVYVIDKDGLTLAASNYEKPTTFVGRNYGFRPYFKQAIDGELGRYFAFGIASFRRGYYFSSPVWIDGEISGVVVVKINVDAFESVWRGNQSQIAVVDKYGIIFMSSRIDWHFKSLVTLPSETLAAIQKSRQYPPGVIKPLAIESREAGPNGTLVFSLDEAPEPESFLVQKAQMQEAEWTVYILSPLASASTQTYIAFFLSLFSVLFVLLVAAVLLQRRARLMDRIAAQREAQETLEKRVAERTADLNTANRQLMSEVEERTAAEEQLRQTQADLVQASKLAALGQMSAALSHELNQPLGAVRSYAENAAIFLDRKQPEDARSNISRISELVDRMAAISKHLRNFARKPREKLEPIPVATVINDACAIMDGKVKSKMMALEISLPDRELWALGGQVRLQQVLVNLISNALDAMSERAKLPVITISAEENEGRVFIKVRDHGPGLSEEIADQIFDPFFTTKGISKGLGLGLSISYNIVKDFGGTLGYKNHPEGGVVMIVDLPAVAKPEEVAAE
ncbi:MAG: sensor histidine kinase [Proteobacteria bacterium]|nr:sensor histidine kinase [Pseudomonadota bacterium]